MIKRLVACLYLLGWCTAAFADDVPQWKVIPAKSSIAWEAQYSGKPVKGVFPEFSGAIAFDPANLTASHVKIDIAVAKLKSDDGDAQSNLPESDWFDVAQFPVAIFEATHFTYRGNDASMAGKGNEYNGSWFNAEGTLSIRGKTVNVTLPFITDFSDDKGVRYAKIDGTATIKRTDFGVGQGDWAKTDAVADEVKVTVHLEAVQAP